MARASDAARVLAENHSRAEFSASLEMSTVVRMVEDAMARLAEGDVTVELRQDALPQRYQGLGRAFNATVAVLASVIHEVEQGAQALLMSSEVLADRSRIAAGRAGQQSGSVEESAVAMTQLAAGVQATQALVFEADAMMAANQKEAQAGGSVLEQAVAAMQRIEESSHQISRISAVMEDIAFQTNLLALNDGVEAARADDLGRGFAVVASAVRELSQRASDATKEIRSLISDRRKNVARGAELVGKTGESLGALIKTAGKTALIVTEIAAKIREQTTGLAALSANISVVEKTAQAGAHLAQQSSTLGVQLHGEALSYARFWVTRPDQAALVLAGSQSATTFVNLTPLMTRGN